MTDAELKVFLDAIKKFDADHDTPEKARAYLKKLYAQLDWPWPLDTVDATLPETQEE